MHHALVALALICFIVNQTLATCVAVVASWNSFNEKYMRT